MKTKAVNPQYMTISGERVVVLEEAQYRRLASLAGIEPPLPAPDAQGNYPAGEALAVILARKIMRRRRIAGLSQVELAKRAGVRPETINRVEQGKHSPSIATIEKLDRALTKAGAPDTAASG